MVPLELAKYGTTLQTYTKMKQWGWVDHNGRPVSWYHWYKLGQARSYRDN